MLWDTKQIGGISSQLAIIPRPQGFLTGNEVGQITTSSPGLSIGKEVGQISTVVFSSILQKKTHCPSWSVKECSKDS